MTTESVLSTGDLLRTRGSSQKTLKNFQSITYSDLRTFLRQPGHLGAIIPRELDIVFRSGVSKRSSSSKVNQRS